MSYFIAAKIATCETSKLGAEPRYMRKLLQLVRSKMGSDNVDITMKFTLSALWNLTGQIIQSCYFLILFNKILIYLQFEVYK